MSARLRLRRADGQLYLDRWGWECRWVGVFVHRMEAPDPGEDLHNHPWPFLSIILAGGYIEERCRGPRATELMAAMHARWPDTATAGVRERRRRFSAKVMRAVDAHRVTDLLDERSWSLVIRGRKVQPWGFFLPTGWVDWRTYDEKHRRGALFAEISNVDDPRMAKQ